MRIFVQTARVASACAWALMVSQRPIWMLGVPEKQKVEATSSRLEVCVLKQDLWDHVALRLVGPDNKSIYRSLCQESHFYSEPSALSVDSGSEDDLSGLLLHWYKTLLRPIVIGERAVFESDSESSISHVISIQLSKREYELALNYIHKMDEEVKAGKVDYVALDHLRTFASALFSKTKDPTPVFLNCATYVEGALDAVGVPKRESPFLEAACTWPSAVVDRSTHESQRRDLE